MNIVHLEGRMGSDTIIKINSAGKEQVFFYLVNRLNKIEQYTPTFIPCLAFGNKAVLIAKYIRKGDLFSIEGYIKKYPHGDSYAQYVIVQEVHFITRSSKNFFEHARFKGGKPNKVDRESYFKKRF